MTEVSGKAGEPNGWRYSEREKAALPKTSAPLPIPSHDPTVPQAEEQWVMRAIVSALCLVALIATTGALVLSLMNRAVPQLLLALGSCAVGALIALLVIPSTRTVRAKDSSKGGQ
jgi:hypothetical protein